MTKSYKFKKNLMLVMSMLCTFGPLVVFSIMGFVQGEGKEKLCLAMIMIAAIALSVFAVWKKLHLRSTTYILMIGLWICLDKLLPFIITIGICTILDELVFTPLYKIFNREYHSNKTFDKRLSTISNVEESAAKR